MADTQHSDPSARASAGARLAAKRAAKAARKAANREAREAEEAEAKEAQEAQAQLGGPQLGGPPGGPASGSAGTPVDDEITRTVEQASSWVDRNQRKLWGGLIVALLVGAAVVMVTSMQEDAGREATNALAGGSKAATAPVVPETDLETDTSQADEQLTFPSLSARAKEVKAEFDKAAEQHPDTDAAIWAKLGAANAQLELGEHEAAQKAYKALLGSGDGPTLGDEMAQDTVRLRALEGLGFSLEGQRKYQEAVEAFERIGKLADGAYAAPAGLHVARMYSAMDQTDKAIERLKSVLTTLEERAVATTDGARFDGVKADVEQRLTELGAPPERKPTNGLPPELLQQLQQMGAGQ